MRLISSSRKRRTRIAKVILSWAGIFGLAQPASAALLAYDGLNYGPGLSLSGQSGGGSFGFSQSWSLGGISTPHHVVSEPGLADPTGTLSTSGNLGAINMVSTSGFTSAWRDLSQQLGTAGTRRYLSVLLQPESQLGAGEAGGYFGVELRSSGTSLFVGKPSVHRYVLENIGGTGQSASSVVPVVGETVLLVVRADFESGNDTFRLYVNPIPGQSEPLAPDAIKSDSDVGLVNAIGTFSTGAFSFDEIRVGETFADVAPIPEPGSGLLAAIALIALVPLQRT